MIHRAGTPLPASFPASVFQPACATAEANAVELVEERGLTDFTGREVARRAGVSHGAPRRYFPTLESLLAAVAVRGFAMLGNDLGHAAGELPETDARARLMAIAQRYVRFAVDHPALFEVMFRHDLLANSGQGLRAHSTDVFAVAQGAVAAVIDVEGTDLVAERTAVDLWAGIHGLATLAARRAIEVIATDPVEVLVERQVRAHLGA